MSPARRTERPGDGSSWPHPPRLLSLGNREVHVWRARLDLDAGALERLKRTLSDDELIRARRLLMEHAALRFMTGRGLLRMILSLYLDIAPDKIVFAYSPDGKPGLAPGPETLPKRRRLEFNAAHSQDRALFAVAGPSSAGSPGIGVDLESTLRELEHEQIARRFFSPPENEALRRLPAGRRQEAFFKVWTRKEAVLKAMGTGLTFPLDETDVSGPDILVGPAGPVSAASSQKKTRWSLVELKPYPGFPGALAVPGPRPRVRRYTFHP